MKKSRILLIVMIGSILASCSDSFLEVKPKAALDQNALANAAGVNALLIGAYSLLDGWATPEGAYRSYQSSGDNFVYGSVASDDAYKGTIAGDQPPISLIEQHAITSDNVYFRGKWRAVYDGIARANDVIQILPLVTNMTDAQKAQVIAEARFLRAHYHMEAKKMWNNVPYIDDVVYNPADLNSTKVPNTTDIWPKIIADLEAAIAVLPVPSATQKGRGNKWSATAMLAKAYMFMGDYAKAEPLLQQIIDLNVYRLVDLYVDNFRATTNNNAESIFEIQHSVNDGAPGGENGNNGATLNYPYGGGGVTTCCGFFQPSQNLVNSFRVDGAGLPFLTTFNDTDVKNDQGLEITVAFIPETAPLDPRLDHTVGRRGIPFLDWGVHPGKSYVRDQAYGGPYSPKKHVMFKSDVGTNTFAGNARQNANNYRMIRYSHILLWMAEVKANKAAPDLAAATALVNQIRTRAARPEGFVKKADGVTPAANYVVGLYPAPFADVATANLAIRFEQRLEFGMEGHRRFDLVRWGVAAATLNAYYAKEGLAGKRTYLNGVTFQAGKHEYFPIPIQEILNSQVAGQVTLKQNPNY